MLLLAFGFFDASRERAGKMDGVGVGEEQPLPAGDLAPAATALFLPVQRAGSSGALISFTPFAANEEAISEVRSVE